MRKLLNSSLMFFLLFSFSAIADILKTLPIALDTLIFKTHGMHYTQFGDQLDKVTLELAGLTEVYREDADGGKYVVYLEKGTKDFQIYYWPITQSFLVTFEGNSATNFFDLLENLKLADAASSQVGTGKPDMLISKGFPPKFISISYPEGMAEGLTGFLFRISRNKSKPINKFIYDLTYDLVLYRETLGLNKILDLYLFTKAAENLYERKFPDGTEAFVAINDNVVGITATELNLNDLKDYVVTFSENSYVSSFFPLADDKYQMINTHTGKLFTVSFSYDVRGEAIDLTFPLGETTGLRIFTNK